MMDAITAAYDGDIQIIDSTFFRADQQAATAQRGIEIIVFVAPRLSYDQNSCGRRCARGSDPAQPDSGTGARRADRR